AGRRLCADRSVGPGRAVVIRSPSRGSTCRARAKTRQLLSVSGVGRQACALRFDKTEVNSVDHTPGFSRRETAITQAPGASYAARWPCVPGLGATLVAQTPWSLPACDPEPGRVSGLISGDPDPVTPSRTGGSRLQQ